jgi:hypothetical protein
MSALLHSRGCWVDVLAHPLAVRLGALAPRLGLTDLDLGLRGLLELCLLPFQGNLGRSRGVTALGISYLRV